MQTVEANVIAGPQGMRLATAQLIEKLKEGKQGDVLTDEELSSLCGRKTCVNGDGYHNLMQAIKNVERNHGLVWQRVAGSGCIKCITDEEKLARLGGKIDHIGRVARREMNVGATINLSALPKDRQMEAGAKVAVLGLHRQFGTKKAVKALETRGTMKAPDMAKMLEMFQK